MVNGATNIRAGQWEETSDAGCSIFAIIFFLLHLLQEQTLVQICACLKGMWVSCFHVSFFSCFLTFLICHFSSLVAERLLTPQGLPRTRLQSCCQPAAPAHAGIKIFAMCYVPTGTYILSQKLRANATCWVIPAEKHLTK